ncbi:MAG TPA: oligosaccharide flippase family protein [Kofleriaceae bacterium]|jgi:O-antigen/teichoic acid export membrane protein
MSSPPVSTNVNRGLAWLGVAASLVGVLDLVAIVVIVNRWISVEEYGIAKKCVWVFPVLDQATDLGLSLAVIQRNDHTPQRISTVFWMNTMISVGLFLIILAAAPPLSIWVYGQPIVGWMLVAYGAKLILQNGYFIPWAMMKRELRYGEMSAIRVVANVVEFGTKIGFAAAGFGIWCFVLAPLCRTVTYFIGTQLRQRYRPLFAFSLSDARDYVTFGLRTSASQILFYFYTNVDYPIVGYFFGDAALGLYSMAYEIVLEPVRMISNIVVDIAFPTFARLRGNKTALVDQFVSFTRLNLITVMAFSAVVFVASNEVISLLYPAYHGAETAIKILCIVAILRAVGFVAPPLLDGLGHPERTLRYMMTCAVLMPLSFVLSAMFLGPYFGFNSVALAWAIGYPVAFAVLMFMAIRTIGWSVAKYLRAVGGVALSMVAAGATAWGVYRFLPAVTGLRFGVTCAVVAVTAALLLAYTQGLTLRGVAQSMKAKKPPDAPPPQEPPVAL